MLPLAIINGVLFVLNVFCAAWNFSSDPVDVGLGIFNAFVAVMCFSSMMMCVYAIERG